MLPPIAISRNRPMLNAALLTPPFICKRRPAALNALTFGMAAMLVARLTANPGLAHVVTILPIRYSASARATLSTLSIVSPRLMLSP